ncbi:MULTISPECIES: asparagine synthase-related protein [unclassified Saccharopolyspora]|uniref:asparagine synthase-related protein n=1 Tax=unclassified Saccharopolyspora TaxID=2646250 RepID=UPI001CD786A5|nr:MULTISPECIES: asparagine synthase-related protein [unclassified Saccharopolyspora]MCA1188302.1 asparagine synthase [Saccharopolyspora sp. 6T]MCA1193488.1 asparagine synthase [Saccharopolyspora sp. 6V]MCA1229492.1 asparagine synthase [Saccharopolyspora sp. 6M]MCA1280517.1 asparagine synthase [Saccharopolyspora sp. 7B]
MNGEWLVVLPDHPESASIADSLRPARRVQHHSGLPWLVGDWNPADLRVGSAGGSRVAALGVCAADTAELDRIARRAGSVTDLDRTTFDVPGCYHLFASVRGKVRAQGTLSGLRKLMHTRIGGVTAAATRADVLGPLAGSTVDPQRLLLRLLLSEVALHTVHAPLWAGVQAVDEDDCLVLDERGRPRAHRRWTPPPAELPLAEAAVGLRDALDRAVRARTGSGLVLSSDLSGGLDSTTLCFLAAREDRPLTTLTTLAADLGDDDPEWADLAAESLPRINRLQYEFGELPTHYEDLLEPGLPWDEPFPGIEDRRTYRALAAELGAAGSELHLSGDGGDEVLPGGSAGVFDFLLRHPWTAFAQLRGYRALEHWTWADIARMAWEQRRTYPAWLADRARTVIASPLDDEGASALLQLPPWATPDAVDAVRDLLIAEAESARDVPWTEHHTTWGIRQCAGLVRGTVPVYAAGGVRLSSPYLDDAVIAACAAARPHERRSPWRYKPLLVEAMRGLVPERSLRRSTKAEGSNLEHSGIRRNVAALAALCEDSRLAALGLIDADRLRSVCTGLQLRLFTPYAMSTTFGCERWLRDLEAETAPELVEQEVS